MPSMRARPQVGIQRVSAMAASALRPQVLRIHRDEPLRRGQEDDRVVAAPAVRIRVVEVLAVPEPPTRGKRRLHVRVGFPHLLAGKQLHRVVIVAAGVERGVDVEPVLHARAVVVGAVPGRRVHRAGAGLERHVVAEHGQRIAGVAADAGRPGPPSPLRGTSPAACRTSGRSSPPPTPPAPWRRSRPCRSRRRHRTRRRDGRRSPGSTGSSTAWSSRSAPTPGCPASAGTRAAASATLTSLSGNSTVIDGDTCGSYSTSASASAVRQCVHQCTGFLPL